MMSDEKNFIKFLGTAGARFVVTRQLRSSAGVWYNFDGVNILLDSGPGTLVKCNSSKPKLDPAKLDGIILTHKHIDHSTDINIMIEAMTDGGFKKRGFLYTTEEAISDDAVILKYVRKFVPKIDILKEGASYKINDELSFSTPVKHFHTVETYGIKFKLNKLIISHVVDTYYFDKLIDAYKGSDILILHVVRLRDEKDKEKGILHLNLDTAKKLIAGVKPEIAVLTHFGMTMVRAKPWLIAENLSDELGTKIIAASDGLKFDLGEFLR